MSADILFLCPHNAAKSVIAAAYFNRLERENDLPFTADSAGTAPAEVVAPSVVAMLGREELDVAQHQPRRVTNSEIGAAARIIPMGCTVDEIGIAPERIEQWSDVPTVSTDSNRAREAIRAHVEQLIAELRAGPPLQGA